MTVATKKKPQKPQWRVSSAAEPLDDPLLDCLVLLTEHYGTPCSAQALTVGLPMTDAVLTVDLFEQAAERAGLKAKITCKALDAMPALLLPCVLLLQDKKACLLQQIDIERQEALIVTSENGGEQRLPLSELEAVYSGYALLVKKQYRADNHTDIPLHEHQGHWFWRTVTDAAPFYQDALIASLLINVFALVSPLFVMNVYDKIVPNLAFESLWVLSSGALLAFVFDFVMKKMRSHLIDTAGKKIDIIVSSRIFSRVMGIPLAQRAKSIGSMAKQLGEFDGIRDMLTSATLTACVDLPFALLFLGVIYIFAGDLALIPLIAGLCILGFAFTQHFRLKRAINEANKYVNQRHGHLIESLAAYEAIKANVAEGIVQKSWQQMTAHSANWNFQVKQLSNNVTYFAALMLQVTAVAVVVLGVYRLSTENITMGGIIAAVMLSSRAVAPMAQLAGLMNRWSQTQAGIKQLNSIMAMDDEFAHKGQLISRKRLQGDISASSLCFHYPQQANPALYPCNFDIREGEKIAILGKNGSGKSTLIRLLAGLYQPTQGSLRFDGVDSKQIHPADLRRNIGYLAQDVTLFHGSIRENIMFGTKQVTEHQLKRAVTLSGVGSFTAIDAEGLDKQVGERGEMLSRGQRQSVALARALLNDPPLLIMDEPTASLDVHAENQFILAMQKAATARTLLVITHKMSVLQLVDRIIVVDQGYIVLDGKKEQVLSQLSQTTAEKADEK